MTVSPSDFRVSTMIPSTSPLASRSFAGKVEQALIQKFGDESICRVLESWRLLDLGYEHREFASSAAKKEPNISFCYQHAPSYIRGLRCTTFWDLSEIDWAQKLKKYYKIIRDEFLVVTHDIEQLQKKGNNIWAGALSDHAGSYGEGWKTLVLMNRGMWDKANCNLFPKTAKCVRDSNIPAVEIFFASMKANSSIKMHSDFTNFVLTSHLAIDIPDNGQNKCRLSVGDDTREWINGEVMLFDTSIMHDAVNDADSTRYILMFRVWHPDLSKMERDALQFIYDCLEFPDLLCSDTHTRLNAEKSVKDFKTFPEMQGVKGFGNASRKISKQLKR